MGFRSDAWVCAHKCIQTFEDRTKAERKAKDKKTEKTFLSELVSLTQSNGFIIYSISLFLLSRTYLQIDA